MLNKIHSFFIRLGLHPIVSFFLLEAVFLVICALPAFLLPNDKFLFGIQDLPYNVIGLLGGIALFGIVNFINSNNSLKYFKKSIKK